MITKDLLWKSIIEDFFPELMAFFYPETLGMLDFSKFTFLDKELEQIFPESADNPRYADKLVKVRRSDGAEVWQMVHIEVQGYRDNDFEKRMFRYYYRILDRYDIPIEAFALLTDPYPNYRPSMYQASSFRTRQTYEFYTYKLLDQDKAALEKDPNPFALVMLVALKALHAGQLKDPDLLKLKISLFRKLLDRGDSKPRIAQLTTFIKYYGAFEKPKMNRKFDQTVAAITQDEQAMGIIENILQKTRKDAFEEGIEKGIEKGIETGMEKGMEKGIETGSARTLRSNIGKLLLKGFAVEQVAEILEVELALVRKVAAALRKAGKLK